MPKISRLIPLLTLALLLSACSFSLAEDITPPPGSEQRISTDVPISSSNMLYPILPPDPQAGASIYAEGCASCHGMEGRGDGAQAAQLTIPVSALSAPETARQATLAEWYAVVSQGKLEHLMPPFPNLTDRQKWDVVAYAYTLSVPAEALTQGQALYAQNCAACHGENGHGDGPQAAALASLPADLTSQAHMTSQSDADLYATISNGLAPAMPAYADQLSDEERWALAAFVRTFSFAAASHTSAYPPPEAYPLPGMPAAVPTAAPTPLGTGSVLVQMVNGSGSHLPADLPVTLYGLDEMSLVVSHTLKTGADGLYTFAGIEMPPGRSFLAVADHAGAVYGSDIIQAGNVPSELALELVIYDASTDASVLTVDRVHMLIEFLDSRNLQVVEVFTISNPTNRTVVAAEEGGPVTFFPLPEGATNLQFQDSVLGERYLAVPGGFADTKNVLPGLAGYQVVFAFEMPYSRGLEFIQPVNMTTDAFLVILPDVGVKLRSDLLQEDEGRDFQGAQYRVYRSGSLSVGGQVTFEISGSPKLSDPFQFTPEVAKNLAIGLVTFGLAVILAGVWLFRSSKADEARATAQAATRLALPVTEELPDDPEMLMDAIIALDDLHQAGSLPDEEHQSRRAALKERLKSRLGR